MLKIMGITFHQQKQNKEMSHTLALRLQHTERSPSPDLNIRQEADHQIRHFGATRGQGEAVTSFPGLAMDKFIFLNLKMGLQRSNLITSVIA